ncbi:MAG: SDR family oxidoreductase [Labrys sp. (in: a-proteobacteria)]|jgi:nucleoside-diphosphate-sugar epimerase
MNLLVFGLGYSTQRFVDLYGHRFARVTGTVRSAEKAQALAARYQIPVAVFDGFAPSPVLLEAIATATHILVSVPPDGQGDPVLRMLRETLAAAPDLAWIGYLSTVGVYGDHDGAWVDERSALRPVSERGVRRVEAENAWLALGQARGVPVQLFRLGGIYGPGQNAVENLREGTARRIVKPGQVFNRIHVDDIAGAVMAGIGHPTVGPAINVVDDEPAPPQDVVTYAAERLGVEPPPLIDFEAANLSPMGRSFYGENKRVSNRLLRERLKYQMTFPTYREGMAAFLPG